MKTQNFTGIIIKKRPFLEKDLIVTVISSEGLRHDLLAKGANGRSKRKSHLELMNLIQGTFYEGKTKQYLQSVQCIKSFHKLKENLELIMKVNLILEIMNYTVLENDPHKTAFELLKNVLEEMNEKDPHKLSAEVALIKLAHELGFLPNFKECSTCHKQLTEDTAKWDGINGTINCASCASKTNQAFPLKFRKAFEFLKQSQQGEHRKIIFTDDESEIIQDFVPGLFTRHLNKPLKSLTAL